MTFGRDTANGQTSNITISNNIILCGTIGTTVGGGVLMNDGSLTYDATQVGPVGCTIGLQITPNIIAGQSQAVNGNFKGQIGSFSSLHDIYIVPGPHGRVGFVYFETQVFVGGAGGPSTSVPVYIDCTAASDAALGAGCFEISFNGLEAVGGNNSPTIFQVNAGPGGPNGFSIIGSTLCQSSAAASGGQALLINFNQGPNPNSVILPGHFVITGNRIGEGCQGNGDPNGITLNITGTPTAPYGEILISNNDLSGAVNAIKYTPAQTTDNVLIQNNVGIDNFLGGVASAATITLPASLNIAGLSGTTEVDTISGAWTNRKFTLIPQGAVHFNASGGGNICTDLTTTGQVPIDLIYNIGESCWNLK
jgi:hypothetical protein